ncbi:TRAP transporter substrate-binding protein [Mangrovicoccus algicola]|uniref:TRAP transporter substrate-binding protein n=1 Tax=Mangrovicoccus algicola TaxID=2771008 RepID=A0A8J6YWD8_9RHOB|nr:TRAP transporter substrate-binding protein [Mangrovicoccus algicola]MBE3637268.1 TRAP transporter substrate-binding protein [Mangrovicoccus algicola]
MRAFLVPFLILAALPAEARDYRLGLITPPPHQWTKSAEAAAAEIAEATGGRVNILVFPSGQLGSEAHVLQQLQTGAVDFSMMTLGEFASRDADYGIFHAPYLVEDIAAAGDLLQGEVAAGLLQGMSQFGLHGLGWGLAGMRQVLLAAPAEDVGALAGRKIRTVPLAPEMEFWSLLGAAPTPMPLPALYDAFANGQVDGMQIDYEGSWNTGYYTHGGQMLASDHMIFPMAAVASGRSWAAMAPEDRAVVEEVFSERLKDLVGLYAGIDAENRERIEAAGLTVTEVGRDWFEPAVSAWYDAWHEKTPLLAELEKEAAR